MTDDRRAPGMIQPLPATPVLAIEDRPVRGGLVPGGSGTDDSAETTVPPVDDRSRVAQALSEVAVGRLFAAGLELEAVVGLLSEHRASGKICHAIDEMDKAIRDIREEIFRSQSR